MGGRKFDSVVPSGLGAQALGRAPLGFLIEPALARGAAGFGRLARLGGEQRAAHQISKALLGLAAVAFLGALVARDDEQVTLGGERGGR